MTAVSLAAGTASALAMAPVGAWPILFITIPVLIWVLDAVHLNRESGGGDQIGRLGCRFRRAALQGWAFGFGYFLAGVYWIGFSFLVDADRYAWLMPFAVAGIAGGLSLFYALAAGLAALMWRRGAARVFAFAFAFFLAEAGRGYLLTGFPWNLLGQAFAATSAQMQAAAYIGVYGLTLAALLLFPAVALLFASPSARFGRCYALAALVMLLFLAEYASGVLRLKHGTGEIAGTRVRIVQPDIPQRAKDDPKNGAWIFQRTLDLSRLDAGSSGTGGLTHLIWPETALPFLLTFNGVIPEEARKYLAGAVPPHGSLIAGAERAEGHHDATGRVVFDRVFNSLFVLGDSARVEAVYDKQHLVPFGEYTPLHALLGRIRLDFSQQPDGFETGAKRAPLFPTPGAPPFVPLICYEIIFPGQAVNENARPGWLVNITNDAWFGNSSGPYQHLQQARIRAVEEGLPVVRAANTGISAVIDPYGRVLAKLDLGTEGVIDHGLPEPLPPTFYARTRLPAFIVLFLFPLLIYLFMVARFGWRDTRKDCPAFSH